MVEILLCHSGPILSTMAVTRHAHFAVLTVQIFLTFRGKYTTIHFSTDIITSKIDEYWLKKYQQK